MSTKFGQVMKKEILLTKPHLLCIDLKKTCKKKGEKCPKGHLIFDTSSKRPGTNMNMKLHIFVFDFTARKKENYLFA